MEEAKKFMASLMQTLNERIGNPIIGAFCIAWVIWNFKIVLVIFSSGKDGWRDKINFIFKEEMKSGQDWLIHGYILPAIAAIIWIFFMPPILRKIQVWHEGELNKTRKEIYKAKNERVLTKEEEVALRNHILEERTKIVEDKEKYSKALQESVRAHEELTNKYIDQQSENSTLSIKLEDANEREKLLNLDIKKLNEIATPKPIEIKASSIRDQNRKIKALEDIGFGVDTDPQPNYSPITHDVFQFEFPMQIQRDIIYEGETIFFFKQILEDLIVASLISIAEYVKKNGNDSVSENVFIGMLNSSLPEYTMNLRHALKKSNYIEYSGDDEILKIKIKQNAVNAGHLLQKLGFKKTHYHLINKVSTAM